MGVFDSLVITDGSLTQLAEIARPFGPLEDGYFDQTGTWIPSQRDTLIACNSEQAPGFGIDPQGRAYYDSQHVDVGDAVALRVAGATGAIWLEN